MSVDQLLTTPPLLPSGGSLARRTDLVIGGGSVSTQLTAAELIQRCRPELETHVFARHDALLATSCWAS